MVEGSLMSYSRAMLSNQHKAVVSYRPAPFTVHLGKYDSPREGPSVMVVSRTIGNMSRKREVLGNSGDEEAANLTYSCKPILCL